MNQKAAMAGIALVLVLSGCRTASSPNLSSIESETDRCGAAEYQHYIGQPLTVIDRMKFIHPTRAISYRSTVTMDFNLNRLNFLGDSQGNISRVYCG